jgi:D-alanine-D-alanine ligase
MAALAAGISYEDLCIEILRTAQCDLQPLPDWKVSK